MSDGRATLEETLAAIGPYIAFPPEPDLVAEVRARLASRSKNEGVALPPPSAGASGTVLRLAVAALVLTIVATGVLVFSPAARHAVAGWLGLPGIRITITHHSPKASASGSLPTSSPSGKLHLHLGRPTSLARAQQRLGELVLLPSSSEVGAQAGIYTLPDSPVVWVAYRPSPTLPAVGPGTDVGLLVTELRAGPLDEYFYKKLLGGGAGVKNVSVEGHPGFWIHGQPHTIQYHFSRGIKQESGRVSGNALIWTSGPITYRLELAADLQTALAIAGSFK